MAVWEARIKQGAVTSVYFETCFKKKKGKFCAAACYMLDQVLETVVCHYFFLFIELLNPRHINVFHISLPHCSL